MELAPLTVLNQRYTVKRTLGDPGPFDITYLGQDVDSDEEFIIREFFPTHLVDREDEKTSIEMKGEEEADLFDSGLEYYRKESEVLAGLSHEALPSSYDTFEANGTFYRVRPHPPSMSLAKGLQDKGQLSEKAALTLMMPVLEALHLAHENGLYHGGVSPQTVRLLEGGEVLLTGFRGAFFQLARESGTMSDLVQSGTSAVEQYTPRGQQGPWTDVYAAAATICQMVTGETLPESTDRLEGEDSLEDLVQDADVFSAPGVREALIDALAVDPSQRLQAVDALINALTESSTRYDEDEASYTIIPVDPDTGEEETGAEQDEVEVLSTRTEGDRAARASGRDRQDSSSNRMALMVGIPVLVLALGGGAWLMLSSGSASSATSGSYEEYRRRADSLFENQNYETAEFLYNQALEIRGDDEHVQERLDKLEQIQQEGSQERYERFLQRASTIKAEADSLYDAGAASEAASRYSRALGVYYSAQDANPEGEEAQAQIDAIQARQEEIAKQQAGGDGSGGVSIDQMATFFQQRGDRQLEAGNLRAALDNYREALEYKPNDSGLEQAVADLEEEVQEQERERKFQSLYNEGQQLLRAGNYEEAKTAFNNAGEVMPDDPRIENALARADSLLQEHQQQTQQYEHYRAQGDSLFEAGAFEEAIASYKNALDIRSDDDYVKSRIEQANRELEEMRLAQQQIQKEEQKRQEIIDEDGVYTTVDEEPTVKGGLASLTQDATYPSDAQRQGLEGRVYIQVVVNADGTVREAEVVRGVAEPLNEEALRVTRNAEFEPGTYNGENVPARTTVWIQFRSQN